MRRATLKLNTPVLITTFIVVFMNTSANAQSTIDQNVNAIVDAVARMCALPSEKGYELEYGGSAEAGVIVRLVGVKGEGRLTKKEWEGIQDVLEKDRASDRESSRDCAQNVLPMMLKAYGVGEESRSLLQQQYKLQEYFTANDPVLRAVAFREAFRSHSTFYIDLVPKNPDDDRAERNEAHNERLITNAIGYYDLESGVFASRGPPPSGFLGGQISGDTLTFAARSCTGRLRNQKGTWVFSGPVVCGSEHYTGRFDLR